MQRLTGRVNKLEQRKPTVQPAGLDPEMLIIYCRAVVTTYETIQGIEDVYCSIDLAFYLMCRDYLANNVVKRHLA